MHSITIPTPLYIFNVHRTFGGCTHRAQVMGIEGNQFSQTQFHNDSPGSAGLCIAVVDFSATQILRLHVTYTQMNVSGFHLPELCVVLMCMQMLRCVIIVAFQCTSCSCGPDSEAMS